MISNLTPDNPINQHLSMKTNPLYSLINLLRLAGCRCRFPGLFLAVLAWLASAPLVPAQTQAPESMTFQGFLTDAAGNPLANMNPLNYQIIFRIYTNATAGNNLWTEQQIVTVDKGNFSVLLGDGSAVPGTPRPPLSSVFAANAPERFVGLSIDTGDGAGLRELMPRLRLVTAPYAFLASQARDLVSSTGSVINSTNVALRSGGNTFSGTQAFNGQIRLDHTNGFNQTSVGRFNVDAPNVVGGRFTVLTNGNVGIGNNTPSAPLHVAASSNAAPNLNGIYVRNAVNSSGRHAVLAAQVAGSLGGNPFLSLDVFGQSGWSIGLDNADNNKLKFSSSWDFGANSTRMTVTTDGNVGIGTHTPQYRMDVNGAVNATEYRINGVPLAGNSGVLHAHSNQSTHTQGAWLEWNRLNGDGGTWLLNQKGLGPGGFNFGEVSTTNTVTTRMKIASNGNVGIGANNPAGLLHLSAQADTELVLESLTTGLEAGRSWSLLSKREFSLDGTPTFQIRDRTANQPRLVISQGGNVGVGTTVPTQKLHVVGNVTASGNVGIGTTTPATKLDVRGDIKLGNTGQLFAASGEENLRIVRGKVRLQGTPPNQSPVITSGAGFSVTRVTSQPNGTAGTIGIGYRITFTTAFADAPAVTVTPTHDPNSSFAAFHYATRVEWSTPSEAVVSFTSGSNFADSPFSFIAVGVRQP
jgi:hypothetical protein